MIPQCDSTRYQVIKALSNEAPFSLAVVLCQISSHETLRPAQIVIRNFWLQTIIWNPWFWYTPLYDFCTLSILTCLSQHQVEHRHTEIAGGVLSHSRRWCTLQYGIISFHHFQCEALIKVNTKPQNLVWTSQIRNNLCQTKLNPPIENRIQQPTVNINAYHSLFRLQPGAFKIIILHRPGDSRFFRWIFH